MENINRLDPHQGVYGLFQGGTIVYVGKADQPLPERLTDHRIKISGRMNIVADEMRFKAVYLAKTWVPLAPETMMIAHYRGQEMCEWNGTGFGPHDPGRRREETDKPPDGFDHQFPIRADWPCAGVNAGRYEANDLLQRIKAVLPFCFRYQTDKPKGGWKSGSKLYNGKKIEVPASDMPAARLIASIAAQLGAEWQATKFPSHIILYAEQEDYTYGEVLR
jgi:hypothetical protein